MAADDDRKNRHRSLRKQRHRSAADYQAFAKALAEDIFDGLDLEEVEALGRIDDRVLAEREARFVQRCKEEGIDPESIEREVRRKLGPFYRPPRPKDAP